MAKRNNITSEEDRQENELSKQYSKFSSKTLIQPQYL